MSPVPLQTYQWILKDLLWKQKKKKEKKKKRKNNETNQSKLSLLAAWLIYVSWKITAVKVTSPKNSEAIAKFLVGLISWSMQW